MWPPPTHVQRNHDSRTTNQKKGRPRNVALLGTIPHTQKDR